MDVTWWIPGVGHWKLGHRHRGLLLPTLFFCFMALSVWRWGVIVDSLRHTLRKVSGEQLVYTIHHFDFLFASLSALLMPIVLILYSVLSSRRLERKGIEEGQWSIIRSQFKKNRLAVYGTVIILFLYLVAILAPLLSPYDPTEQGNRVLERLLEPSTEHLLGTDRFARDVFSRIVYGSRISLLVGFMAVAISVTIGTVYGAIAGYAGKWVDSIMMRFVDMMLAFPTLILIITVIAVFRKQSIWMIIAVIGVLSWPGVARLVRAEFLLLKELDFFHAALALGAGPPRLIFRHLLPNALTPVIVSSTLRVGTTILVEASLSYLGLGVQPPTASWGNIVYDTKGNIFTEWWMPLSAGLAITITVIAYNLFGDGLRDALDPRLRD